MLIPTVRPVHNWRNLKNRDGLYPIHLEIKINGVRKYYPIPVPQKVSLAQWSGKDDAWVKASHPFAFEINNKIREKKNLVLELIKRYYSVTQSLTFSVVLSALKKSANTNIFNDFFADYIKHPTDKLEPDTFKKYKACLDHLQKFNRCIRFHDLNPELIEDFHQYLKNVAKL